MNHRSDAARAVSLALMWVGLAAASAATGVGLAAMAMRFNEAAPIALLGIVTLPLLGLLVLTDPRVGVVLVLMTFPVGLVALPLLGLPLGIVDVAVLGVIVLVPLQRLAAGEPLMGWATPMWWAAALLFWTLVALPSALEREPALKQVASLAAGILLACAVLAVCKRMKDVRLILGALVFIAALIGTGAASEGSALEAQLQGTRVSGRAAGSFDHPNQLASLSALAGMVAIGLTLGARSHPARIAAAIALLPLTAGLLLSLSRGAWIGVAVALALVALSLSRARRVLMAASIPLVLISLSLGSYVADSPQVDVIGQRFGALTTPSPYDERPNIWAEARRQIFDDPLTGQGPGNFPTASQRAASAAPTVYAYHAHNIALTWGAESGLPAVGLLVALATAIALRTKRASSRLRGVDEADRSLLVCTGAGLLALLVQGVVDYTLRNSIVFYAVWTVIAALLAMCRFAMSERSSAPAIGPRSSLT